MRLIFDASLYTSRPYGRKGAVALRDPMLPCFTVQHGVSLFRYLRALSIVHHRPDRMQDRFRDSRRIERDKWIEVSRAA